MKNFIELRIPSRFINDGGVSPCSITDKWDKSNRVLSIGTAVIESVPNFLGLAEAIQE